MPSLLESTWYSKPHSLKLELYLSDREEKLVDPRKHLHEITSKDQVERPVDFKIEG